MKKYGQKLLAFMLATAMVAGDFIPAMAAAPAEAVASDTEAELEGTAEEAKTDETVSETEEQPEQTGNAEAVAEEQGTEAGEAAAPADVEHTVMFTDKVEIPKEDTTEVSWWFDNISVPAGQKKTIKYRPTMEDAYIISTDVKEGVTLDISNEKESGGSSYGWMASNQLYQAYVYSRSEEEDRDLGTVTAVVDNTTEEEIVVWLNTASGSAYDALPLDRMVTIPVDASEPNRLYGYSYTAMENGIYEILGAEPAMIWSSVYGGKQLIGEKEFALVEGESVVILATGKSKSIGISQVNEDVVEDEELTVDGRYVFVPTSSGEYLYDEPGPIEYYDTEMNRWVPWYSGSLMWMSEEQAYFIRGTADAEETPVLYRGDGAVKTDIEKLVITPESNQFELSWNESTESYEPATFYATVHGYNAEGLESYVDWDSVTWYLTGPDGEESEEIEVEDASNITVSETGVYTLSAEVRSGRKKVTAETQIVVTEGQKAYPLEDATLSIASNVDKNLTLGDIRDEIAEKLNANLDYGNVVIMDQELKQVGDTTKLKRGTTEWIAYYYLNDTSDTYAPASSATVTVKYGDLKLKQLSEPNDNILVLENVTGSPYGKSKHVWPKYTLNGVELNGEELENLGYRIVNVTGKAGNKGILRTAIENNVCVAYPEKIGTDTLSWSEVLESPYTGSQLTLKGSLKLTVKGQTGRAVGDIAITLADGNKAEVVRCLASDVKSAAAEYTVTLNMKDYDGADYNDAPVTWTTSNKSVASVAADKNGAKVVIPKGAKSGIAQITVTAKTDRQAKASFYVKVVDEDIRLVDTSLFLNSNSDDYGYLELYPNLDWVEAVGCKNPKMDITMLDADGNPDDRFEFDTDEDLMESDYVGIRFSRDAEVKAGTSKAKLNIRLHGDGAEELNVTKDIKVINKPTFPKTTVKLLNGYNTFWNNEAAYAKVQLTTGQEITADDITAAEESAFTIEKIEQSDEDNNTVWEVTLKSKAETPKADNAVLKVQYADYREAATVKVKVTVKKSVPSVGVYADYDTKTVFYPELSGQTTVLVQIPDGMPEQEAVNSLELTKAAEKVFDIVNIEAGYGDTIINGHYVDLGRTLCVTLESKNEKSGNVQFTLTPSNGSGTITTKSWKITVGKVSAEKTIMYDQTNGRTATNLTLQQALVGKERIALGTSISSGALYRGSDVEISYEGADELTRKMLNDGLLKVQKVYGYYYIWGTEKLFEQNANTCKLAFTHTIKNSDTGETVPGPKAFTVTISLKKGAQIVSPTAAVKADWALNVVDIDKWVALGMNLKNLPQGADVLYAELAEEADKDKYVLRGYEEEEGDEEPDTGRAKVYYGYNGYDYGVYLTRKDGAQLPLGKTNVKLNLGVRLTDGSILKVPATVSLNVVQNVSVTAERKTLTLYNAVAGEAYAQWINLMMRVDREYEDGCISAVEVSGLEGTGIAVKIDEDAPSDVRFYIESAAQTKSYKAKVIIHVAGAGTKNGKEVTYTVPMTITVKN